MCKINLLLYWKMCIVILAISEEWKSITVATVPAGLLAIILISVLVWIM